jgi:hypothetical protein
VRYGFALSQLFPRKEAARQITTAGRLKPGRTCLLVYKPPGAWGIMKGKKKIIEIYLLEKIFQVAELEGELLFFMCYVLSLS